MHTIEGYQHLKFILTSPRNDWRRIKNKLADNTEANNCSPYYVADGA